MKMVVQRVKRGCVEVAGEVVGEIGPGVVILVGMTHGDTVEMGRKLLEKIGELRIFEGERSLREVGGEILFVSQFTLYAETKKGRRPSYTEAMRPEEAQALYDALVTYGKDRFSTFETGHFGAEMAVTLTNDGPYTLILNS